MPLNIKLNLAKLELHLFRLLEKTNKKFTVKWEHCQDSNKEPISFQDCSQGYQTIMELVEYNQYKNNLSDLLKSYYLEAWLGKIQSHLNDLPQDPSNEAILLDNDKKIENLTHSFVRLEAELKTFNFLDKKNISAALKKDYQELADKINKYFHSWDKDTHQRRAIYYYNYAETLIEETEETISKSDYDLRIKFFKTAIARLKFSASLYKKAENFAHENETLQRQKKIEIQLKKLEQSLTPTLKIKKISIVQKKSPDLENASKTFVGSYSVKNNDDPRAHSALTLPFKKRKHWIFPDEEEPARKKLKISFLPRNEINKKSPTHQKIYISPSKINVTLDILLKTEEKKVHKREQEFKKILNQAPVSDPFRFYGQLFFDMSQRLEIYSKESSNHTLLTQLSWLTIAEQLIHLIPNKNPDDHAAFKTISGHLSLISYNHKKNLATISSQKRAEAYPTYNSKALEPENLQNLLIKETIDYYYGLEAFKLTSAATNFLDLIAHVINKYSFNPFKEIENTIQSAYKLNVNLFYAKLLRELVKFYTCNENVSWRNNTFSPISQVAFNKECLRILSISQDFAKNSGKDSGNLRNKIQQLKNHLLQQLYGQSLTLPDNAYSSCSFFQSIKQTEPFSTEILIKILQEHFQYLLKYKASTIHSETIYRDLLRFIQTHCKTQTENILSRASQL